MRSPPAGAAEEGSAVDAWLRAQRRACDMQVAEVPRTASKEWELAADGRIRHRTRGFFSITGVQVTKADGEPSQELPMIDQPEIGLLGFVIRPGPDGPEVLVQAKAEPGNVGLVQIAPSVQATESNYRRRHGGKATALLELFSEISPHAVVSNSLQSEQGSRFLGKYNRNAVVQTRSSGDELSSEVFAWFPFAELQPLLLRDSAINTDARSVLATAPWTALAVDGQPFNGRSRQGNWAECLVQSYGAGTAAEVRDPPILQQLQALRQRFAFRATGVPLDALQSWQISDQSIRNASSDSFEVRHYAVTTTQREVEHWDQPLVASSTEGSATLLCQRRSGILSFLFCAQVEPGFREGVQLGPTLQSVDGPGPIFSDVVARDVAWAALASEGSTIATCLHSDEGGRFFRCVSRYSIVELDETVSVPDHETGMWLTLAEVASLIGRQGIFTNEARSLLSMVLAYL